MSGRLGIDNGRSTQKKTVRASQKEEEVGELPRAIENTDGRRSINNRTVKEHFSSSLFANAVHITENPRRLQGFFASCAEITDTNIGIFP